jgi:hypothetical protein
MNFPQSFTDELEKLAADGWISKQLKAVDALQSDGTAGLVSADTIRLRNKEAFKKAAIYGLIGLLLGAGTGAGIGALVGDPVTGAAAGGSVGGSAGAGTGALSGGLLGSIAGITSGSAHGQAVADKKILAEHGITAKMPIPVRSFMLPYILGTVLPTSSHASLKIGHKKEAGSIFAPKPAKEPTPIKVPKALNLSEEDELKVKKALQIGQTAAQIIERGSPENRNPLLRATKVLGLRIGNTAANKAIDTVADRAR